MTPLKKKWVAQLTFTITEDRGLVRAAAKSGCVGLFFGLESFNSWSLKNSNKKHNVVEKYKDGINVVPIYGGASIETQFRALKKGAQIIVATPGRMLEHCERGSADLTCLRALVLDEADRMLDIGFRPDIEKILRRCPQSRQTLLLSATIPPPVPVPAKPGPPRALVRPDPSSGAPGTARTRPRPARTTAGGPA